VNADGYLVVYDILRDGIGVAPVAVCLGMLLGCVFGIALLVSQRKRRKSVVGVALWVVGWVTASLFGGGNVLYQHFCCVAWARSDDFQVLEGRVTQFHPLVRGKGAESFTVAGVTFSYGDSSLGQGGFRYTFGVGGLLKEGVQVRVAHREGRILKLEVRSE
jgi:hypothetical protein